MLRWMSCRTWHPDLVSTPTKRKLHNSIKKVLPSIEREQGTTCRICQSRVIARISPKSPSSSQILTLTTICQLKLQILSKAALWQIKVGVRHFRGVKAPKHLPRNSKCMKQSLIVRRKDQLRGISDQRTFHVIKSARTNHRNKSQRTWRMKVAMRGTSRLVGSRQSTGMDCRMLRRRRYRKSLGDSLRKHQAWCTRVKSELLTDSTLLSRLHTTRSNMLHKNSYRSEINTTRKTRSMQHSRSV